MSDVLLGRIDGGFRRKGSACIDSQGARKLNGAAADGWGDLAVFRDPGEHLAGAVSVTLGQCRERDHFAGGTEEGFAGLGQWRKTGDDLVRFQLVIFDHGSAHGREIAVGLRQAVVRGESLVDFKCRLAVILAQRESRSRKFRTGPDDIKTLVAGLNEAREKLGKGVGK